MRRKKLVSKAISFILTLSLGVSGVISAAPGLNVQAASLEADTQQEELVVNENAAGNESDAVGIGEAVQEEVQNQESLGDEEEEDTLAGDTSAEEQSKSVEENKITEKAGEGTAKESTEAPDARTATDDVFTALQTEIDETVAEGLEKTSYTNNYQSMQEEPFTFAGGTGTSEVNNGLTVKFTGGNTPILARLDNSPYLLNGIVDLKKFSVNSSDNRIGVLIKANNDYRGVTIRCDALSGTGTGTWVIQNEQDGSYETFQGPALDSNQEYRLRVGFLGKKLIVALDDQILFNQESRTMSDEAVQLRGQAGFVKRYSAEGSIKVNDPGLVITGIGTKEHPVMPPVKYQQDFEGEYTPNWSNGSSSISKAAIKTEDGNKVLEIGSGVQRVYDVDSPMVSEGTLSLRYKAVAAEGSEPGRFGFRFGVTDGNKEFRELNWDGGRWVVESQSGYPSIDMPKPISGAWNNLCINFREGSMTVYQNGEEMGTYELDVLKNGKAGRFGIRSWGSTSVLIDDVIYTNEMITPEPIPQYENNFEDSITGTWSKGAPSIALDGENKVLKLAGLNNEMSQLNDSSAIRLAYGTYLAKVKTNDANIGFQFGNGVVKYDTTRGIWTASANGETKDLAEANSDTASKMSPKLRGWNAIGIVVKEKELTLSINGTSAGTVFSAAISQEDYLGISAASDIYVDDLKYTGKFLAFSTAQSGKVFYEENYDMPSETDWVGLTDSTVADGYLTGKISANTGALNNEVQIPDHGVFQAKLQADQIGVGLQIGNLAVYNTSETEWYLKDILTGNSVPVEIGTSDTIAVSTDYVVRVELVEGSLILKVNGKQVGVQDVSSIFDKSQGGFGIYNSAASENNVKVDALGVEEIRIFEEDFSAVNEEDWANGGTAGTVTGVDGKAEVNLPGVTTMLYKKSMQMKNFAASFDFKVNVDSSAAGGRYGFYFREDDSFKKGFSVEMDINGNWRVGVGGASYPFGKTAVIEKDVTYKAQVDVNGKIVALKLTDDKGVVTDFGTVTVNVLPEVEGCFGVRSWYSGKKITLDNLKMVEVPAISTLKLKGEAVELTKGDLTVSVDSKFPRIMSYGLNGKQMTGEEKQVDTLYINGKAYTPSVTSTKNTDSITYNMSISELKLELTAKLSLEDNNVVTFEVTNLTENGDFRVRSISMDGNRWASINNLKADSNSTIAWTSSSGEWHGVSEEIIENWDDIKKTTSRGTTVSILSGDGLAISVENNVMSGGNKVILDQNVQPLIKKASIRNGIWTYRHPSASDDQTEKLPWAKIVVTEDRNADAAVDWQDGAVAHRKFIQTKVFGAQDMPNNMMYIGFNFASQANDTFLNTLDTGKVLYNYMDGFGQLILHKGYQAEGHDDDIPSYSNIGVRQGGIDELKYLLDEGAKYNMGIGVHLNATEYHTDANELYYDNLQGATTEGYTKDKLNKNWDWIDVGYLVDQTKDVLTEVLEKRFDDLYKKTKTEKGNQLDFYYIDVYTGNDYNAYKLLEFANERNIKIGTEFSGPIEPGAAFTHWGPDLGYPNKGNMSRLSRMLKNDTDIFVGNALYKGLKIPVVDTWGDSKTDIQQGVEVFYNEVLPTKFMQHYGVLKTETDQITFENDVVSKRNSGTKMIELSKDGQLISTWKDTGTTTDEGERHAGEALSMIPWTWNVTDGTPVGVNDGAKLYHWNPAGGESTWTLTNEFKDVPQFDLYKTTQHGKEKIDTINTVGGKITLNVEKNTPYVLYPSTNSNVLEAAGNWGEGSPVKDFAFNAEKFSENDGTDSLWKKDGDATIEVVSGRPEYSIEKEMSVNRLNRFAQFKTQGGTLTQQITDLVPGENYTIGVWTEAENGRTSKIEVTVGDKTYTNFVTGKDGTHRTSFKYVNTKWQRMAVEFKVPEGVTTGTIKLIASAGDGTVSYDDVKVWKHTTVEEDPNNPGYVLYEDFENTYEGWGPFEYGGGSRRIALCTDKSQVGLDDNEIVSAGEGKMGPVMTWVLNGENALKSNETGAGKYIVTRESELKLKPNTTYDLSFKYTMENKVQYGVFVRPVTLTDDTMDAPFINLDNQKFINLEKTPNTGDKKTFQEFNGTFKTGNADNYQVYIYMKDVETNDKGEFVGPSSGAAFVLDDFSVKYNLETIKKEFMNLYNKNKVLEETDCVAGWTELQTALAAVKSVAESTTATVEQYLEALETLKEGTKDLLLNLGENLDTAITAAKALEASKANYSALSYAKLTKAIKAAEEVKDRTDKVAVAKAMKDMKDAQDALVNIVAANTSVAEAKKITNSGYTNSTWEAFQNAVSTIENLIKNDSTLTQAKLDMEVNKLAAAKTGLKKKATEQEIRTLTDLYNKYAGKDGDYTVKSYAAMKVALTEASPLIGNKDNITSVEVNEAVKKLQNAEKALEKKASLTQIQQMNKLYTTYNGKEASYTTQSFAAMKTALAQIKALLANQANVSEQAAKAAIDKAVAAEKLLVSSITGIKLNVSSKTIGTGEKYKLTAKATPAGVPVGTLKWSSSNKNVTVDSKGQITGKKSGKATITVKTANGKTAYCKVTVKAAPTKIALNASKKTLCVKEKYTLKIAKLTPAKTYTGTLVWKSSKSSVAAVDKKGKVTAKKPGTATITVKTSNGKTASCKVTVKAAPTKITLNASKKTMGVKEKFTLKIAKLTPTKSYAGTVVWKSSKSSVASVDKKGRVTAKKPGKATIKVTAPNGKSASCTITVKKAPTKIKLSAKTTKIKVKKTIVLKTTFNKGQGGTVKYTTSNKKVATVDANGKVKGLKKGTATITAKTYNGKKATIKITVK